MTRPSSLKTVSLVATTAAATILLMQACGGAALAQTAADADPIEGVWESDVTIRDCSTSAVLRTFKGVGLQPQVTGASWEQIRGLIYEGRGA